MPIDSPEKLSKAKELLQKAEMKLNSQLERPDYSDDLPEVQKLKSVINSARSQVNSYDSSSRQVDPQTNRLTADAGIGEEIRVGDGNALTNEYFYEPSLQSVRERIVSDPSLAERLGLPKFAVPERMSQQNVGQRAVQDALHSQGVQPLPSADTIDEQSSVYKAIAEDDWKKRVEQAKKEGKSLVRYSKVKLKDSPADTIVGGGLKQIGGFASAVAQSIPGVRTVSRAVDEELLREGRKPLEASETMDELVQQAPIAGAVGTIVGAARPGSIGNMVGNKVAKTLKYADRSPVGKATVAGVSGAAGSVAEGEALGLDEAVASEDEGALDDFISQAGERATGNAVLGYGMGKGGDVLAQAAQGGAASLRNFSPAVKGLRELENAGGDLRMPTGAVGVPVPGSAMLSPVRVPDEVMGNFRASAKDGEILSPIEIAANKVGPQIAESVDQQAQAAYRQAGESLEKYHNSPQGMSAKRVTKPARVMLDMIREGQNVGDLGTVGDAVPKIAKKLRERLMNEVERKEVSIDEYDRLKAQYGDDIIDLDPSDADNLLGASKQEQVQASVQPQVQPKTSVTQVEDVVAEPVNPFDPPAKNMSPEATADTIPVPVAEPIVDARDVGTVPPKGKQKKADGKVAGKADRDVTPTKLYENSNKARNEYGEKMRPYREAMRASDMRTENLMDEFSYVQNAEPRPEPSELELGRTEFPNDSPFPKSDVEDISDSKVDEIVSLPPKLDPNKVKELSSQSDEIASKLSPEEVDAVHSFTNRHGDKVGSPEWKSAVAKLTVKNPTKAGPLFRGTRMTSEQINQVLKSGKYSTKDPTSLSFNEDLADAFSEARTSRGDKVMFVIEDLDEGASFLSKKLGIGKSGLEREINLANPASFKVLGSSTEDGVTRIRLASDRSSKGKSGPKTVLVPRARNSRQIEKIQQDIAEDLQGISKDSDWLKKVDKAFRETRDQFEPNEFTPGEMTLDDGTKVTGLSALQRKHHELFKEIEEMKADTSSKSKTAILNKIKAFASGQNGTADKELLEQAKKLGLEKELRQVAATRVVPGLKTAGSPLENEKGIFTGLKNAGIQRMLPVLEAVGNVPGNPFIANPNTPAGRIQKYLFENSAKNLLNFEGGRLGRFGNEVNDLREKDK